MIKVGITGGIGVGKTTVCNIFDILGTPIYYADDRAKWLMENSTEIKHNIIKSFGSEAYIYNILNRPYLGRIVFSSKENTDKINAIVHPVVVKDFEYWVSLQKAPFILKEAALMFESNSHKQLDKIICVTSPLTIRIKRVLQRDSHRKQKDIENIINKQLSEEEKIKRSDFIIENGEEKLVIPQVLQVYKKLTGII